MTPDNLTLTVIDLSGLSPDQVWAVESFVRHLRSADPPGAEGGLAFGRRATDEEFELALAELASGGPVASLPPDFSRADIYADHD